MDQDRAEARIGLKIGLSLVAAGSALFLAGWGRNLPWLLDSAFVLVLVGWIVLVISGAYWLVLSLAGRFPRKRG